VGDAKENLLDLLCANFGIKPIERVRTSESSVGFLKPGDGLFSTPEHLFGKSRNPSESDESIGLVCP
jgi:hypothetical protein